MVNIVVASWMIDHLSPVGGPGVIVEVDEAYKFGKHKYNKGTYKEGQWVLGGVDKKAEQCFLFPCQEIVEVLQRITFTIQPVPLFCLS